MKTISLCRIDSNCLFVFLKMLKYGKQNSKIFNIWGGGTAPSPDPTPRRTMAIDRNGNFLFHALIKVVILWKEFLITRRQSDNEIESQAIGIFCNHGVLAKPTSGATTAQMLRGTAIWLGRMKVDDTDNGDKSCRGHIPVPLAVSPLTPTPIETYHYFLFASWR